MRRFVSFGILCLAVAAAWIGIHAQNPSSQPASASPAFATDYPVDKAGIFIRGSSWEPLMDQDPTKARTARGYADTFSYKTVPAKVVVAEYDGEHATIQVDAGEPTICICNMASLPGQPVIVRLHVKKGARELDGGRTIVYQVNGESKIADANKSDLIPVDQLEQDSHIWRDAHIWLIRPQSTLPPGEYALMFGTQNLSIFSFTITEPASASAETKANP
jgi:hypothetical protein